MSDTRDLEARSAIVDLTHTLEQMIQLAGNHLFLVALKPKLEQIRHQLIPEATIIPRGARPALPGAIQETGAPPPTDNGGPFFGCRSCARTSDELVALGHAPDCAAIRNPTIIQVG